MKLGRKHSLSLALVLLAACGVADGPPEIALDRTACDHCGMLISELGYAAAFKMPGEPARVFDDIGCMLDELRGLPVGERTALWFHAYDADTWLTPETAVFVRSPELRTPMAGGVVAFASAEEAARLAAELETRVISRFDELLAEPVEGASNE